MRKGMVFMGMGFELVGLMIGALFVGQALDRAANLGGMGTAGMMILSLVGWLYHLIVLLKKYQKENLSNPPSNPGPSA